MQIVIIVQNCLILPSLILHPKLCRCRLGGRMGGSDFFEKLCFLCPLFYLMAQPQSHPSPSLLPTVIGSNKIIVNTIVSMQEIKKFAVHLDESISF